MWRSARGSHRLLILSFASVVLLFVFTRLAGTYVGIWTIRKTRAVNDDLVRSIELVSRMDHDVARKRLLIEDHIFESEALPMARVEGQIGQVESNFAAAGREYDRLEKSSREEHAWLRFSGAVA